MTKTHYSLDVETLGIGKRAVVLSIGVCAFSLVSGEASGHALIRLDPDEQLRRGRTVTASTVDWWLGNPEAYRWTRGLAHQPPLGDMNYDWQAARTTPPYEMSEALVILRQELTVGEKVVWVNGPAFDAALVEGLAEDAGVECPVHYREWRDVRTLLRMAGVTREEMAAVPSGLPHDALSDAVAQAGHVALAYRKLGVATE